MGNADSKKLWKAAHSGNITAVKIATESRVYKAGVNVNRTKEEFVRAAANGWLYARMPRMPPAGGTLQAAAPSRVGSTALLRVAAAKGHPPIV